MTSFSYDDLLLHSDSPRAKYHRRQGEVKTAVHWGQRKLLLSEIEFFTLYLNEQEVPEPLCVYAGAAHGIHIPILSDMFPSLTFHLYDPSQFLIEDTDKITIFNEYFTPEIAKKYAGRQDVFFISDIRTADYRSSEKEALRKSGVDKYNKLLVQEVLNKALVSHEDRIWDDMVLQQSFVEIIKPVQSLLKFHLPFAIAGVDENFEYFKGVILLQTWPGPTSTETRLVPDKSYEKRVWSSLKYEEQLFYHNTVRRIQEYINPLTGVLGFIDAPELLDDYDSTAETFILMLWLKKISFAGDLQSKVVDISRSITNRLNISKKFVSLNQRRHKSLTLESYSSSMQPLSVDVTNNKCVDDDKYELLRTDLSLNEIVVRLATIQGPDCFIHAVLKAMYKEYQESKDCLNRVDIVKKLRRDLAYKLQLQDTKNPKHTVWETAANSSYILGVLAELVNPELLDKGFEDYSLRGIQDSLNSDSYITPALYQYISDEIGIDIYLFEGTVVVQEGYVSIDLDLLLGTGRSTLSRPAICLIGEYSSPCEVLAVYRDGLFQTIFNPEDPFIIGVKRLLPEKPESLETPEQVFIDGVKGVVRVGETDDEKESILNTLVRRIGRMDKEEPITQLVKQVEIVGVEYFL